MEARGDDSSLRWRVVVTGTGFPVRRSLRDRSRHGGCRTSGIRLSRAAFILMPWACAQGGTLTGRLMTEVLDLLVKFGMAGPLRLGRRQMKKASAWVGVR